MIEKKAVAKEFNKNEKKEEKSFLDWNHSLCEEGVLGQESRGEAEKWGNGGLLTTAGMKVCPQSGSKESWECGVQNHSTDKGEEARVEKAAGSQKRRASFKRRDER